MDTVNATEICSLSLEKENQSRYDKKLATFFRKTYILK